MRKKVCVILVVALAVLCGVPFWAQKGEDTPLQKKAKALKKHLENKGFTVNEGQFLPLNAVEWYCSGFLYSCNMNNAGAPYNIVHPPPPPEGNYGTDTPFPSFRMRRDEAVVLVGPTPPKCTYYSYALFLWYRWDQAQGRTRKLFDTLGQPLNRFLLNTGGSDFDKNIVLTFTSDKKVDKDVREAARDAGFPEDVLNTYVVPSSGLNTNQALDSASDSMVIVQRTALVTGPKNAEDPIILRVTPTSPTPAPSSSPSPPPSSGCAARERPRWTGSPRSRRSARASWPVIRGEPPRSTRPSSTWSRAPSPSRAGSTRWAIRATPPTWGPRRTSSWPTIRRIS